MAQLPRSAAVDAAAAENDCDAWEDVLDVDDSDLHINPTSSSRPLHPSTAAALHRDNPSRPAHDQRIPGPASAVQDARRLRDSGVSLAPGRADAHAADADFLLHPWLCALQFLGKDRAWERPGIKHIMANRELDRAPLVVGVVTSCKPNELGDLFLTLKDPTGTIGASVHRKVLSEGNVSHDLSVGCVIVLTKIAIFRPSHTACYLNITQGKVVKVLRKDCGPPFKQDVSSEVKWEETQLFAHLGGEPLGTSEGTASIFSKMVSRTKHIKVADLHSKAGTENFVRGTILGLDISKTCNNKNADSWEQRQGGSLTMFERGEAEGSANIIMGRLGREKIMPSRKERTVAGVSCDHQRPPDSSNSTSAHESSSCTDGPHQKSFNTPNTCSQPIPGTSSTIPGDRASTQASNSEKPRLPFADEIMLLSSKKLKTNAVHPDCYDATMNTSIDMDIDVHDMAEPVHGGHSSTCKPDGHQQNDIRAASTGTAKSTKETSATDAVANSESLLLHRRRAISVAPVAGWTDCTDEQLSELFADYSVGV